MKPGRYLSPEAKGWFGVCLLMMVFGGFYLGFWYSCQNPRPIDVPYVTADSYFENQQAAQEVFKDYLGAALCCSCRTSGKASG